MKFKLIICVVALLVVSCFISCQGKNSANIESKSAMTNNESTDSITLSNPTNDSLFNAINQDIDSVKEEIIDSKKEIAGLLASNKELQSDVKKVLFISLGAFVVSIVAIILLFIKIGKKVDIDEISLLNKDINYIKNAYNMLEYNFKQSENQRKANSSSRGGINEQNSLVASIEKRLSYLEKTMKTSDTHNSKYSLYGKDISDSKKEVKQEERFESHCSASVNKRVEYAQLNNEKYFMDTSCSKQETCVYKIEYSEQNVGVFDLISLDKIQSSNGWQDVIDIEPTGDCTMEEAKDFVTLSLGECRKIDENTWKVTTNLMIKISK